MEKQKMTIHRALAELKLLDAKIEKGINEIFPVGIVQKGKKIDGHISEEDLSTNAKSGFDSITNLIDRKVKIKSAIVKSNSNTFVTVGDKQLTVSDAISFKTVIDLKKKFTNQLKVRNTQAISAMNKNNDIVNKNVEILLSQAFGKDSTKIAKEDADNVSKPYLENNIFRLVDPLLIADKIKVLEEETGNFEAEVDAVLSETNATTFIEI